MKTRPQRQKSDRSSSKGAPVLNTAVRSLWKKACQGRSQAHAPYSHFRVGAAVEGASGRRWTGCNVENASYGATVCAERVAIWKAVSEGQKRFRRVVVVAENAAGTPVPPCGQCLQVLTEFCTPETEVWLASPRKILAGYFLKNLLPISFSSQDLSSLSR